MILKKVLSIALCVLMLSAMIMGCGKGENISETESATDPVQNKTAVIAYNPTAYGGSWLVRAAEEFEKLYGQEGYHLELKISDTGNNNPILEIPLGPDRNDVDLYLEAGNLRQALDHSNNIMRGESAVLADLTELVWNQPAIGLDKQEEGQTIAQRYFFDKEILIYDGSLEEFHGGIYSLPMSISAYGIVLNPSVTEQYGYGLDNLPVTTDEFNEMCRKIAETSAQTGIYAYSYPGSNAPGFISEIFFEYFAQYSGREAFNNFVRGVPPTGDSAEEIRKNGWMVYQDPGILEGFRALEPIMKPEYCAPGSNEMMHIEAERQVAVGEVACSFSGGWFLKDMQEQYFQEASQCILLNTPILSVIGEECGITDEELSQAVRMVDAGESNQQIIAQISGLDETEVQRIRDARNLYSMGEESPLVTCAAIPAYADGKEVAALFLRFLCSEDVCRIVREESFRINAFTCESYENTQTNPFTDSVLSCINPGYGNYIAMDVAASEIRTSSQMLYFNHPNNIQPVTFKNMILNTSGMMTAEIMFENEKNYARDNWSIWAAYMD